eukprot:977790-Prymnesium_polylepis.1
MFSLPDDVGQCRPHDTVTVANIGFSRQVRSSAAAPRPSRVRLRSELLLFSPTKGTDQHTTHGTRGVHPHR